MQAISGHTRPYAVLGHPIGHSLSPAMHNASIQSLGLDAVYLAFDVHPDALMGVLPAMHQMGFGGVNLTVPLKEVAFRGLRDLDPTAERVGAVNTVEFLSGGGMRGHNTDGYGFVRDVRESLGAALRGLSVVVLGSGGAGRAIAITCGVEGAREVVLCDIDAGRSERAAADVRRWSADVVVSALGAGDAAWVAACQRADLVVQCSPLGMKKGDPSPVAAAAFRGGQLAYDLVYMYPETPFMRSARANGAKAANGLGMLLYQGARAFAIWSGQEPDAEAMRRALVQSVYGGSAS
jgi:shikimate dehydrogenase